MLDVSLLAYFNRLLAYSVLTDIEVHSRRYKYLDQNHDEKDRTLTYYHVLIGV